MKKLLYVLTPFLFYACGGEEPESVESQGIDVPVDSTAVDSVAEEIIIPTGDSFEKLRKVPGGHTTALGVANDGAIWIGSSKQGVWKLGEEDEQFCQREHEVGYLVRAVHGDAKGNLWVVFSVPKDGIAHYNGEYWSFFYEEESGIDRPFDVREDGSGNLYFSSNELIMFDGVSWSEIHVDFEKDFMNTIHQVSVYDVNLLGDIAVMYVDGGHGSELLVRKSGEWTNFSLDHEIMMEGSANSIHMSESGDVYLGFWSGLSVLKGDSVIKYTGEDLGYEGKFVYGIKDFDEDAAGNIWMATTEGVKKLSEEGFVDLKLPDDSDTEFDFIQVCDSVVYAIANNTLYKLD